MAVIQKNIDNFIKNNVKQKGDLDAKEKKYEDLNSKTVEHKVLQNDEEKIANLREELCENNTYVKAILTRINALPDREIYFAALVEMGLRGDALGAAYHFFCGEKLDVLTSNLKERSKEMMVVAMSRSNQEKIKYWPNLYNPEPLKEPPCRNYLPSMDG